MAAGGAAGHRGGRRPAPLGLPDLHAPVRRRPSRLPDGMEPRDARDGLLGGSPIPGARRMATPWLAAHLAGRPGAAPSRSCRCRAPASRRGSPSSPGPMARDGPPSARTACPARTGRPMASASGSGGAGRSPARSARVERSGSSPSRSRIRLRRQRGRRSTARQGIAPQCREGRPCPASTRAGGPRPIGRDGGDARANVSQPEYAMRATTNRPFDGRTVLRTARRSASPSSSAPLAHRPRTGGGHGPAILAGTARRGAAPGAVVVAGGEPDLHPPDVIGDRPALRLVLGLLLGLLAGKPRPRGRRGDRERARLQRRLALLEGLRRGSEPVAAVTRRMAAQRRPSRSSPRDALPGGGSASPATSRPPAGGP